MGEDKGEGIGCALVSGLIIGFLLSGAFIVFFTNPIGHETRQMHNEAVTTGHAEYYLDENNERQWRWKECGHD